MDRGGWTVYAAWNDPMTSHNTFRIAVIAGDGIGREVIPAGMAALEAAVRGSNAAIAFTEFPSGSPDSMRSTSARSARRRCPITSRSGN